MVLFLDYLFGSIDVYVFLMWKPYYFDYYSFII